MYILSNTLHKEWPVIVKSYNHVLQIEIVPGKLYPTQICVIMNSKHMYHIEMKKNSLVKRTLDPFQYKGIVLPVFEIPW